MNLSKLSDSELDASAILAARSERAALHVVLEHLEEVQRRKSFSPKFKSIHDYAMGELKYDDKSAWRRVNAMFLMIQLPEIKGSIQSGELDLSKLVAVQNHIRIENQAANKYSEPNLFGTETPKSKLTKEEKLEVVKSVVGKSSRETVRCLAARSSAPQKIKAPDQVRPLAQDANEVRLTLSDEDLKVLREIKDLLAHKHPNATLSELVSVALMEAKTAIENKKAGTLRRRGADKPVRAGDENKRGPSAALKRRIYARAKGVCEICGSRHSTEYDHRLAWAQGGKTTFENMRLVCRNCNHRESIKIFGGDRRPC